MNKFLKVFFISLLFSGLIFIFAPKASAAELTSSINSGPSKTIAQVVSIGTYYCYVTSPCHDTIILKPEIVLDPIYTEISFYNGYTVEQHVLEVIQQEDPDDNGEYHAICRIQFIYHTY